jgi:hypothetical protein
MAATAGRVDARWWTLLLGIGFVVCLLSRFHWSFGVPGLAGCRAEISTLAGLDACLAGLKFDSSPGAGDEQPLMVLDPIRGVPCPRVADSVRYKESGTQKAAEQSPEKKCRYGPIATIEPEKHAHRWSDGDLKKGRIIARLSIASGQTEGYEKFGLVPGGTTYWWVQKTSHTGGRSVYISKVRGKEGDSLFVKERPLTIEYHSDYGGHKALAKWLWDPDDETSWGRCGDACCR